ncbi:MAG: SsrA-binding protein SmpB [bacterium]|jgi:SsrA-binding protein
MAEKPEAAPERNVVVNRRARHDYHFVERYEVGIALVGSEVKSLREGKVSLQEAYAVVEDGEIYIVNMHITPYEKGSHFLPEPKRRRKLLMHKSEIRKLRGRVEQRGLTLIPLRVYFVRGKAKMEIALARGKPGRDRREEIARRDMERDMQRERRAAERSGE